MKISDLIKHLQDAQENCGDLDVALSSCYGECRVIGFVATKCRGGVYARSNSFAGDRVVPHKVENIRRILLVVLEVLPPEMTISELREELENGPR